MNILEEGTYTQASLHPEELVDAIAPAAEDLMVNRYALTDLLIGKAQEMSSPRMLEIFGALIRASTYSDQKAAGERLNAFEKQGFPKDKMDQLRIHVGGETALSPMLAMLSKDLEVYFRIPIKSLNDTTQNNWQNTIRYAQWGFVTRMVMSVVVFLAGIILVGVSSFQFMFATLDTQRLFGNGVSFASGLATMLLIVFTGPLKEDPQRSERFGDRKRGLYRVRASRVCKPAIPFRCTTCSRG